MELSDKAKKALAGTTGGGAVLAAFFYLHGDLKAEITKIKDIVPRVITLETQERERNIRFYNTIQRMDKKLDRLEDKLDKVLK